MEDEKLLWERSRSGDEECTEELIRRYSRLVRMCARSYFLSGGETEDLIQEGMFGLLTAFRTYEPDRGASLSTYAERCVRNRMMDAVKAANRRKNETLNTSLSIDGESFLSETAHLPVQKGPEELLIEEESAERILRGLRSRLTPLEDATLIGYLQGSSYAEIADRVGRPVKSVDNTVRRIRQKLLKMIQNGDYSES